MKSFISFSFLMLCMAWLSLIPASAQALPPSAYVRADGLVIITANGENLIPGDPTSFSLLQWSADGDYLLYQRYGAPTQTLLYNTNTAENRVLTESDRALAATFSADGSSVLYGKTSQTSDSGGQVIALERYNLSDGASTPLGDIPFVFGCGGNSPFPMDAIYNSEAGFGGRDRVFIDTAYGLLHSQNCAGLGLTLTNFETGESVDLGGALSRARLSPSGERIAATSDNSQQITLITLADRSAQAVTTAYPVDQLTWADNNTLVYSTRSLLPEPLPLSFEETDFVAQFGLSANSIPQYEVVLHRLDVNSGAEAELFRQPAWAIGRLMSQNGVLYFSVIGNGESWIEALTNGTIHPGAAESALQTWQSVSVVVMRLSGDSAAELASGVHQFTPKP